MPVGIGEGVARIGFTDRARPIMNKKMRASLDRARGVHKLTPSLSVARFASLRFIE